MLALALALSSLSAAAAFDPNWPSLDSRVNPTWYDEAKVGIFIVGGVFSVPSWGVESGGASGEWFWHNWASGEAPYVNFMEQNYPPEFTYQDFAAQLTFELFNATQWAQLFKASGARYTVFLTKHHDGYDLWPSSVAFNWNSMDVGPHRDVTGEVSAAVKAAGLHSGIYRQSRWWWWWWWCVFVWVCADVQHMCVVVQARVRWVPCELNMCLCVGLRVHARTNKCMFVYLCYTRCLLFNFMRLPPPLPPRPT